MDSAYMGNIMAQIGQEEWGFNMVATTQTNRSGDEKEHLQEHHMAAQHKASYLCSMGGQQYCQDFV